MSSIAARIASIPVRTRKLWGEPSQLDQLFLPPVNANSPDGEGGSTAGCSACGGSSDSPTHSSGSGDGSKLCDQNCLRVSFLAAVAVSVGCLLLYITRPYLRLVLLWMTNIDLKVAAVIFVALFILVSFPMMWGYILLNVAAGYLYGIFAGTVFVAVCALLGMLIAHIVTKRFLGAYVLSKLSSNESLQAILRVVESSKGFKVIVLARLTPIPFGLQNGLFAISKIGLLQYLGASVAGLLPTQILNSYIGTTLRSMEEVLTDSSNTITAYVIFFIQVSNLLAPNFAGCSATFGLSAKEVKLNQIENFQSKRKLALTVALSAYVVRRARLEINKTIRQYDEQDSTSPQEGASITSLTAQQEEPKQGPYIHMNGNAASYFNVPEVKVVDSSDR